MTETIHLFARPRGGPVFVATSDLDRLRFIGVALRRFEQMTADELRARLGERSAGRC